jgi:hypothetical protein
MRFLSTLALGVWIGALLAFGAVLAPVLFSVLPSRDQAGAVVAVALPRMHWLGLLAGLVFLGAGWVREHAATFRRSDTLLVVLMLVLTVCSELDVVRPMHRLRRELVSIERAPEADPRLQAFERLHAVSVGLETAVLVLGIIALYVHTGRPS